MFIRLFCCLMLFILLWGLVPRVAELSHEDVHKVSQTQSFTISTTALRSGLIESKREFPCKSHCDDENCLDHQCHFGHCRTLLTVVSDLAILGQSEFLFFEVFTSPRQEILYSLFKPPAGYFLS